MKKNLLILPFILFSLFLPIFSAKAIGNHFNVDLGASGFQTTDTGWANIASTTDLAWKYLINDDGATSTVVRFKLLNTFNVSTNGTTTSSLYPANATRDAFFNTATSSVMIDGLDPNNGYKFIFYASENNGTATNTTAYALVGTSTSTVNLITRLNANNYAGVDNFKADQLGQATINLSKVVGNYVFFSVLEFYELLRVSAGPDSSVKFNESGVQLSGQAISEGGNITSYLWEKVSGPGGVNIITPNSLITVINNFQGAGDYVFKLTVTDDRGYISSDTITVSVKMVDAGSDKTVVRPGSTVTLDGQILNDGLDTSVNWSEITSNESRIMASSSLSALVQDLAPGVYTFRLTAIKSGGLTQYDDVQVTVVNNPLTIMNTAKKVVIMGDSTAWGSGSSPVVDDAYTFAWGLNAWAGLFNSYFTSFNASNTVVNIGKIGLNSYQALTATVNSRPSIYPDNNITKALSLNPDLLLIGISTNDANAFWPVEETEANFLIFKQIADAQGVPVYFFTPHPRTFTDDGTTTPTERRLRLIALREWLMTNLPNNYIDIWDDFYKEDYIVKDVYNSGDNVHLNNQGHKKMFNRVVNTNLVERLGNRQPVVNYISSNQDINYNSTAHISTTVSDPDGNNLFYSWTQTSGPKTVNISNQTASSTDITGFTQSGTYQFKIKTTDDYSLYVESLVNVNVADQSFNISYIAGSGGTITGSSTQVIASSSNATQVSATPNTGYHFVDWSDGVLTATRTDLNIQANKSVTANFAQDAIENTNISSAPISLPSAIGNGTIDASIPMNESRAIGTLTNSGTNILAYINSQANFQAPESSHGNQLASHSLSISNLDLATNIITITISSEPQILTLQKGEVKLVDLDGDGINDIEVAFADVYVNRAEVTIKALNGQVTTTETPVITVDSTNNTESVTKEELALTTKTNTSLIKRLAGRILLQVETKGQAWYLDKVSLERYYLADGPSAYQALRKFGLGITNTDLNKIPVAPTSVLPSDYVKSANYSTTLTNRLLGRIVLQVENHGEAWYINPTDGYRYYLANGDAAYQIMRNLSLGINNINIRQITVGSWK